MQRAQTSADAKISSEGDAGFKSGISDPDVSQICSKMLWMHYLVCISYFAKNGTNRPLIV